MILRTLFLRDLRDRWVFPRLIYLTTGQAFDRNARRLCRMLVVGPRDRVVQLLFTLRDERGLAELLLAALAVLTAFMRALALLLLAVGSLYVAFSQL
ncbi:MAG TPA: hypothetical protein VHQ43_06530 [Solirubrobacterales bacterium]|nr:hypothetical protein [Solirubrobacterales bacterium]